MGSIVLIFLKRKTHLASGSVWALAPQAVASRTPSVSISQVFKTFLILAWRQNFQLGEWCNVLFTGKLSILTHSLIPHQIHLSPRHVEGPRNPQGTLTTWQILPLLFIFLFHTLQTSCFPVFRFGGGGYRLIQGSTSPLAWLFIALCACVHRPT